VKIIEVCHRTYSSYIGAIEKIVLGLSRCLSERFEIETYTSAPRKKEACVLEIENVKITEFPSTAFGDIFCYSPSLCKALSS
jgi:hypothetical protein